MLPLPVGLISWGTQSLFSSRSSLPPRPPGPEKGLLARASDPSASGRFGNEGDFFREDLLLTPTLSSRTAEQSARRKLSPPARRCAAGTPQPDRLPGQQQGRGRTGRRGVPARQPCLFPSQPELSFGQLTEARQHVNCTWKRVYMSQAGRSLLLTVAEDNFPRLLPFGKGRTATRGFTLRGNRLRAKTQAPTHTGGSAAARRGANSKGGLGKHS